MDIPQFDVHSALEETHWWFTARRTLLLKLLQKLLPQNGLIIDVGCGTGGNTALFAKHFTCIGIDPIPEAIQSAMSRFPDTEFRCGFAPKGIPEIAQADAVLLLDVLEHIEDDFHFVSELLSAMKPNAYLVMMAPADIALWSTHDKGFDHYRRYSLERFTALWKSLPVNEILISHWNSILYWPIRLVRKITRLLGTSVGSAQTDLSMPPKLINSLLHTVVSYENATILSGKGYRHGVSILGVIQKTDIAIQPRKWPVDMPKDDTPWKND